MRVHHIAILLLLPLAYPSAAYPRDFLADLSGKWAGSGQAYLKRLGDVTAGCSVSVSGSPKNATMNGTCRFLLFRQSLGLTLAKVSNNRVTGTYTGARTGPAQLSGTMRGDKLILNVTWGAPVNGDRVAQMVIKRTGENSFEQTVIDKVEGKIRTTSRFSFKRK
ncbi:hypothetical protein LJR098_003497 [Rhizobium sp. LjRoot98]|uniref:hypothetical protein n=1 Tax=Rhizobium sp. LjRoot98 TaxID=3342345 RepID=UPI003ECE6B9F